MSFKSDLLLATLHANHAQQGDLTGKNYRGDRANYTPKAPASGGGGVSSWNDLTDKPFEEGYDELLMDFTGYFSETGSGVAYEGPLPDSVKLTPGNVYKVAVNSDVYACTAFDLTEMMGGMSCVGLGNFEGDENSHLPFSVMIIDMGGMTVASINISDNTEPAQYNIKIADGNCKLDTVTAADNLIETVGFFKRVSGEVPTMAELEKGYTIKCTDENGAEVIYTESNTIIRTHEESGSIRIYMPYPDGVSVDEYQLVEICANGYEGVIPAGTSFLTYSLHPVVSFTVNGYTRFRKTRERKQLDPQFIPTVNIALSADGQWKIDKTYLEVALALTKGHAICATLNANGAIYGQSAFVYLIPAAGVIQFTWIATTNDGGNYTPTVYAQFSLSSEGALTCEYFND